MRTITGTIILPPNAPAHGQGQLLVEVRDVSQADAASTVIAKQQIPNVSLSANVEVPFHLEVPDGVSGHQLSLRAHLSLDGSAAVKRGDLLTTASHPIPTVGTARLALAVPVKVV